MIKILKHHLVSLHIMTPEPNLKKPNPLSFFQLRTPASPPRHFQYIFISQRYNLEKTIIKWIDDNLKGRFYVGKTVTLKQDDIIEALQVGFEQPKELSYFTLACPYLKYD